MRIVENTPARITLRDRTWWISAVCFSAAAILVADSIARGAAGDKLVPAALSVLFGFAFLRATEIDFDRIARSCVIRRFDVLRPTRRHLRFDEIVDVRIDTSRFPDSDEIGCRLGIVTASGTIMLTAAYEPDPERYSAMREVLLDMLLGDSPRPPADDPVDALVKEGRLIDAVALLRRRDGSSLTAARTRVAALQARVKEEKLER
jgi:hypothetical protein